MNSGKLGSMRQIPYEVLQGDENQAKLCWKAMVRLGPRPCRQILLSVVSNVEIQKDCRKNCCYLIRFNIETIGEKYFVLKCVKFFEF